MIKPLASAKYWWLWPFFWCLPVVATANDSLVVRKMFDSALVQGQSWPMLAKLCKEIGHRLSGSPQSMEAVRMMRHQMLQLGFDSVWLQAVQVPVWKRGAPEQGWYNINRRIGNIQQQNRNRVRLLALGGSVATPNNGLEAEVIEVSSVQALKTKSNSEIQGKIVFINQPMDPRPINTFDAYIGCVGIRYSGVVEAANKGAVGVIIRSLTHLIDTFPHTGAMSYQGAKVKIPAAAISTFDAESLSETLKNQADVRLFMRLNCQSLPDTTGYNVIGEYRGVVKPHEYLLVGGHLDSWDVGEGAHDDGVGVVQSIEAVRLFMALGIRPRHTLRVVLFANEENGLRGGLAYADWARNNAQQHLLAIESDRGGFAPRAFHLDGDAQTLAQLQSLLPLLQPYGISEFRQGFGGADIGPLRDGELWLLGYVPDSQRYFDYHHAASDVLETVNRRELEMGSAAMAALLYLLDSRVFSQP
jgi:hypothetical protein